MNKLLNAPAFGVALGAMWSVGVLLATWLNALTGGLGPHPGWFAPFTRAFDYAIPGYYVGFWGGLWGAVWVFVAGLLVGTLFATIYNRFAVPVDDAPAKPVPVAPEDEDQA